MNKRIRGCISALFLFLLSVSCDKDAHKGETGLVIEPVCNTGTENLRPESTLFVFDGQNRLTDIRTYPDPKELAASCLDIPAGNYTLVLANGLERNFSCSATGGPTLADSLYFEVLPQSEKPVLRYGSMRKQYPARNLDLVRIGLDPFWARLDLRIENLPEDVSLVEVRLKNGTDGFYPVSNRLSPRSRTYFLGTEIPEGSLCRFEKIETSPTLSEAVLEITISKPARPESEIRTVTLPAFQPGGVYRAVLGYEPENSHIELEIISIEGWKEGPDLGNGQTEEEQKKNNSVR